MNILKRLWFKIKANFVSFDQLDNPLVQSTNHNSSQNDIRDIEISKRIARAFRQQKAQMNARALKRHDPRCRDPLTCTKPNCFIQEPDHIVKNK